jgi:Tfp pilus assembly protein PilN
LDSGLVALGLELKGKVLGSATTGAGHLSEAQKLLQSQDVEAVQNELDKAINSFRQSQEDIRNTGALLDNLLNIIPQKRDGQKLIAAAQDAAEAGVYLTEFYKDMQGFKVTPEGVSGKDFADTMVRMSENLQKAEEKLEQAGLKLESISENNIPQEKKLDFVQGRQQLANAITAFRSFRSIFELFRSMAVGSKQVLVVFQNNNELRPTGGFMGTYGAFQITDGQIKISKISSIYDLDGQMKHSFVPPFPIKQVSPIWYLRDTNWFADFPASAKKISEYYEKEGGETPDMVIALTPNLISDLLKITGPVEMPAYGVSLDSDNFVETVQLMTSVKYDKNLNKPKQLLADFFPIFLQKISAQNSDGLLHGLSAIQSNLLSKHLLLYSRNSELATQLKSFNWAGELKKTDRDYLSVIFSNLNGTKTDLFINQNVSLETKIEDAG